MPFGGQGLGVVEGCVCLPAVSMAAHLALKRQLSEARQALSKVRRTERATDARQERQWVLDDGLVDVVILMCWQSGGDVRPAVTYL